MDLPSAAENLPLFRTPTAQLAVNGGSQHPSKRRRGGHGPTLADEVEHELDLFPTPTAHPSGRTGEQHMEMRNAMGRSTPSQLEAAVQLLPSPMAADGSRGSLIFTRGNPTLKGAVLSEDVVSLLSSPAARDFRSGKSNLLERNARPLNEVVEMLLQPSGGIVDWGKYARGVLRWEQVTGRMVPCPLQPGRNGNVLAPVFVEWMMGLPEGWVTGLGLSRTAMLRILGNGVVWQQAVLGLSALLPRVIAACPTL